MNRADRRKSGITEKPKTYTMTDAQLAQVRKDAQAEWFLMQLAIPVLVLSDKFGFDEDKHSDFIASCLTWLQLVHDGEVSMREIIEESEKLANAKFEKKRGK